MRVGETALVLGLGLMFLAHSAWGAYQEIKVTNGGTIQGKVTLGIGILKGLFA